MNPAILEKIYIEAFLLFLVLLWAVMQWYGKLPSISSIQQLSSVLNSRGGNIMVLGTFSLFFFIAAIRFVYYMTGLAVDGKIDVSNAIFTAAFTWMTGMAFGGAFTGMVKAMTGEDSKGRNGDGPNGAGRVTLTAPVAPGAVEVKAVSPDKVEPPQGGSNSSTQSAGGGN